MAEVCGLDIPPQADLPVTVEVDATKASDDGQLSAVASHSDDGTAEVTIEEQEPKKYKLTFQPPKKDLYTLDIKWGENSIQGSPLVLNLHTPNAKSVTIAEPPAGKLKAGQQIKICFDTSNAGRGVMTSTCSGEDVGEVAVDVRRRDFTNKIDVTFQPPHEDEYVVHVKWADKSIKGSPFKIDLIPVNPNKVTTSAPKIPENPDDPIEMEISTKGAGNAKLTATCTGTIGGKIPVNLKKVAPHDYHLSVKPPERDILSLSVQYGGKHIPNSPFLVNTLPVDASKVKVTEPENPEIGQLVCYKLDTLRAGIGIPTVTCVGEKSGPVDVAVTTTNNEHDASFTPQVGDVYTIGIKWGDENSPPNDVPGSPFILSLLLPADASKVKVTEPENPEIGQLVCYKLDTQHAGIGILTVTCVGEKSGPVDVAVTTTNNEHDASFTPQVGDVYTIGIKWGDENSLPNDVPGSPFNLSLLLPADASKVKAGELHVPTEAGSDEWVWLELDCSEAGHGDVTAEAKLEDGEPVEVEIDKTDDDKYRVKFKSDQAGKYNLAVFYGGSPIPESPYSNIEILDLSPKPDLVKHLETKQPEVRGGPAVLLFDTKEAGRGEFRARVAGLLTGQAAPSYELVSDSDHIYEVSFSPQLADTYLVDVYWENDPVTGSPFYVEIIYPDEVVVTEPSKVSLEHPFRFDVDTSNAGPGKLTAKCEIKEKDEEVEAIVAEDPEEADKYTISVHPEEEGIYSVSIFYNEHHVKGSPFDIDLVPKLVNESQGMALLKNEEQEITITEDLAPPSPPTPEPVVPKELHMFIGEPFSYVVGQENLELLRSMTVSAVGEQTGVGEVVRKLNEEDLPCFVFDPEVPDKYTVEIRIDGALLAGNSFVINYIYRIDASKCVIFGAEGLDEKVLVNETISFGVDASMAGDEKLSVTVDGPSSSVEEIKIDVTTTEENPNIYHISYCPTTSGTHRINLLWGGEQIPNSPLMLNVETPRDIPTFFLHKPFMIHFTTDCDPKEIESYAFHDDTCNRYALKIGRQKQGKLKLVLYAKEPGIHSIHILIGGKEIHGSPFKVRFIETDSSVCKVAEIPEMSSVGLETSFKIDTRQAGLGDLHIKAKVPQGGRTDITHVDHKNGFYSIVFTPKVAGNYKFQVLWAGVEISDSPVQVSVSPADEGLLASQQAASRVYVLRDDMSIFSKVLSNLDPVFFHLCAKDAGNGQLTIRATGPYEARIKVDDEKNGTYRITVEPKVSGKYLVNILWNDCPIPGNPFQLDFTNGKSYMINGINLETDYFAVDTPRDYTIDCGNESGGLKVECHPTNAADVDLKPVDGKQNVYVCSVLPKFVGNHSMHVMYDNKHILNSPYIVQFYGADHHERIDQAIDDHEEEERLSSLGSLNLGGDEKENEVTDVSTSPKPAMVKVYGPGLKGGYVGQEGNFTIETAEAGDGKLEVDIRGLKDTFKLYMRHHPDSDRTVLARYDPKYAGEYSIDIAWSGSPVPGSPFIIDIVEQKQLVYSFDL